MIRRPVAQLIAALAALLLAPAFLVGFVSVRTSYATRQLDSLLVREPVMDRLAVMLFPNKLEGSAILTCAFERDDFLPVFGSSELGRGLIPDPYHISLTFARRPTGFVPFLVGRGGCQSLIHLVNIAAQDGLRHRRIVIIISPQWFLPTGIPEVYFNSNFSALQTYRVLYSRHLSQSLKVRIAKRLLTFSTVRDKFPVLAYVLKGYGTANPTDRYLAALSRPLSYLQMQYLEMQDAQEALAVALAVKSDVPAETNMIVGPRGTSWLDLLRMAEMEGKQRSTNNPYGIYNEYFDTYISRDYGKLKDSLRWMTFTQSPEYDDLKLLLDVLREYQIDAVFVSVPVNGLWYDYAGVPQQVREAYYHKVAELIRGQGFKVVDFSTHEYEKYFLKDVMHLGWKGWVYIGEVIDRHYHGTLK